jgi:glycerol-3-phosphate dehydrogenase (NAD+)
MLLSCGVADIIATCFGGRNRKCGKEFAERVLSQKRSPGLLSEGVGGDSGEESSAALWEHIEAELLGGQKLQGVDTCKEVVRCLQATGHLNTPGQFPLFRRIHDIACQGRSLDSLFVWD